MSNELIDIANKIVGSKIHTAGRIEFVRDQGPVRRNVRAQNFKWDPECLRDLTKILWACERSHSYAVSALRIFSRMQAANFSPDGLMGGVGYIQSVKDMRQSLSQAVELISNYCDTLHDEVNADHWSSLPKDEVTNEMMDEVQDTKYDPEGFVEDEYTNDIEDAENFENPDASSMNPVVEGENKEEEEEWNFFSNKTSSLITREDIKRAQPGSELPTDESDPKQGLSYAEMAVNTGWESPPGGNYASSINKIPERFIKKLSERIASSSIPTDTLSGPRVDHIGPAEGGEFGYFNSREDDPSDDPSGEGFWSGDYLYEGYDANPGANNEFSTNGDVTFVKASEVVANYSWLPGSDNNILMNYYERGLSDEDIEFMKENSAPINPMDIKRKHIVNVDPMYEGVI